MSFLLSLVMQKENNFFFKFRCSNAASLFFFNTLNTFPGFITPPCLSCSPRFSCLLPPSSSGWVHFEDVLSFFCKVLLPCCDCNQSHSRDLPPTLQNKGLFSRKRSTWPFAQGSTQSRGKYSVRLPCCRNVEPPVKLTRLSRLGTNIFKLLFIFCPLKLKRGNSCQPDELLDSAKQKMRKHFWGAPYLWLMAGGVGPMLRLWWGNLYGSARKQWQFISLQCVSGDASAWPPRSAMRSLAWW